MKFGLTSVCEALGLSPWRVSQWVTRGVFQTASIRPGEHRQISIDDAMRVALIARLVDSGVDAKISGVLVGKGLYAFKDDEAFLVAWRGELDCGELKFRTPDVWYSEIIRGRDLMKFLNNQGLDVAFIVNLSNLENQVKRALGVSDR